MSSSSLEDESIAKVEWATADGKLQIRFGTGMPGGGTTTNEVRMSLSETSGERGLQFSNQIRQSVRSSGTLLDRLEVLRSRVIFPFIHVRSSELPSKGVKRLLVWRLEHPDSNPVEKCARCPPLALLLFRHQFRKGGQEVRHLGHPVGAWDDGLPARVAELASDAVLPGDETSEGQSIEGAGKAEAVFSHYVGKDIAFPAVVFGSCLGRSVRAFAASIQCNSHFHSNLPFVLRVGYVDVDMKTCAVVGHSYVDLAPIFSVSKFERDKVRSRKRKRSAAKPSPTVSALGSSEGGSSTSSNPSSENSHESKRSRLLLEKELAHLRKVVQYQDGVIKYLSMNNPSYPQPPLTSLSLGMSSVGAMSSFGGPSAGGPMLTGSSALMQQQVSTMYPQQPHVGKASSSMPTPAAISSGTFAGGEPHDLASDNGDNGDGGDDLAVNDSFAQLQQVQQRIQQMQQMQQLAQAQQIQQLQQQQSQQLARNQQLQLQLQQQQLGLSMMPRPPYQHHPGGR